MRVHVEVVCTNRASREAQSGVAVVADDDMRGENGRISSDKANEL